MATDFSSLDKLMEFGMGMGIATQMMNTMNNTLSRTAYAGTGINPGLSTQPKVADNAAEKKTFYIVHGEHVAGPMDEHEMTDLVKKGIVKDKTFCWSPGMESWNFAQDIPEINKILLLHSPQA